MYVGRLLVAGPGVGAYRVSSRSFPNRRIVDRGRALAVVPTADAPETTNPYVSYNCLRAVEGRAVLGNGSHVDPVAEKFASGYPPRDALATALLALDYERDEYDTPRIAAVVENDRAVLGIVRRDALLVETAREASLVATYEKTRPRAFEFGVTDAAAAARRAYDLAFEHPVCAAAATVEEGGVETALHNGDDGDGDGSG